MNRLSFLIQILFTFIFTTQLSFAYVNVSSCVTIDVGFMGVEREARLNQSLSSTGSCITIAIDNLTLDCMNFNITGDSVGLDQGIDVSGINNVSIQNCNIYNFAGKGMGINLVVNSSIDNIYFENNSYALALDNSDYNMITNIIAINNTDNGVGLYTDSNNNILSQITSNYNDRGIRLSNSDYNTIFSSTLNYNNRGLYITNSKFNIITNIVSNYNNENVYLSGTTNNNTISSSNFENPVVNSIYFLTALTVVNNTFMNNYMGNSSFVGSASSDWSNYLGNDFFDNYYSDFDGGAICFGASNPICDDSPSSGPFMAPTRDYIFPFGNILVGVVLVFISLFVN